MYLSPHEQEKLDIIRASISKKITNAQARVMLGLSIRQVKRIKNRVREEGDRGIVHLLKGKRSNHHIDGKIKEKVIGLIQKNYTDFKPTFASEKILEDHGINISPETTRLWMKSTGLWKSHKQKLSKYRCFRSRKEYYGELEQFDGSYHFWFEDRFLDEEEQPIEACLLVSIDDATGIITKAEFAPNEGVVAVFKFWKEYILKIGRPLNIYLDKFSTYKINHKAAVDNKDLVTEFQRAIRELGINLIFASSPQAKGRVERLFKTLQDRLVKEMRLAKVNTPEEGNIFLQNIFLPKFNSRFVVSPTKEGNAHRSIGKQEKKNINDIFSLHEVRRINFDYTIQFKNSWYQLLEIQPTTVRPLETVLVEVWLNESIHFMFKNYELKYVLLSGKPKKIQKQPIVLTTHKLNYIPPANHPWRKFVIKRR
jgi:hypothetical protein